MKQYDVCVIGGGASGMSAALGASLHGAEKVLLIERDIELGGILQQCIHNGFGLHHFHEELTGPAYTTRLLEELKATAVEIKCSTTVIKITDLHLVHYTNSIEGYQIIQVKSIILATGCRERTGYQIDLPGKRLAGIMTAGLAQRYLNIDGYLVGKKVFILGSGDIGLIMARRMTLEGAKVFGVAELMPYSNGLNRNFVQCLHDFDIPLYLSHTITNVEGKDRLQSLTIAKVDSAFNPIPNTEKIFEVDTLLLSIGLIPETKLLSDLHVAINPITNGVIVNDHYETNIKGIYACGNALHVHDLVDFASEEGFLAGKQALKLTTSHALLKIEVQDPIRYVVPSTINQDEDEESVMLKFRVNKPLKQGKVMLICGDQIIKAVRRSPILPAEMETLSVLKSVLPKTTQTLTLKIEQGDERDEC